MTSWRATLAPVIGLALGLVLGGGILVAAGIDPLEALGSFARGIAGSRYQVAEIFVAASPLLFCGLATALVFRAGIFSIGAEGQLLAGMLTATATGLAGAPVVWVLAAGAIGGAAFAGIAAWLKESRRVPEVLGTLLLNFIALHGVSLSVQTVLREPGSTLPQSGPMPFDATLEPWLGGTRFHSGCLIGVALAIVLAVGMARTTHGLRLRAFGAAPAAARLAGFSPARIRATAFVLAGSCAGLGGAIEIGGVTGRLYENPSPGYGYTAIAVALLARNRLLAVPLVALVFGMLEVGCLALTRDLGATRGLAQVIEAAGIAIFLAVDAPVSRAAFARLRAEGTP